MSTVATRSNAVGMASSAALRSSDVGGDGRGDPSSGRASARGVPSAAVAAALAAQDARHCFQ